LIQYDELEASFFRAIQERNLSWFGTLISPTPKDDTLPLLSATKKPYRDLILANTISIFDFRTYLLAQQCSILGRMGRIIELGRKASAFLVDFGRRLKEIKVINGVETLSIAHVYTFQDELPPYFIESWVYSSALSVVDHCDGLGASRNYDGAEMLVFCAMKGQLLELARDQV
jgi:trafficking protein particle complex subunit 10